MRSSPEYAAPELVRGEGCGSGADWWALGVLCFELLCGHTPFAADTCHRTLRNIEQRRLVLPKHLLSGEALLIGDLLTLKESSRLGASDAAVRSHGYFRGLDWAALVREDLSSAAECSEGDTSRYSVVPETLADEDPVLALGGAVRLELEAHVLETLG